MNKKMTFLIVVVFCLICAGSYMIAGPAREINYHNVNLTSSCSANVPLSEEVSTYTDNLNINYYSDYGYNLNITAFNDVRPELSSQGQLRMDNLKKEILGTEKVSENNMTYYKNKDSGAYTVYVEDGKSKNYILISASDFGIFKNVYESLQASVPVNETDLDSMNSTYNQ